MANVRITDLSPYSGGTDLDLLIIENLQTNKTEKIEKRDLQSQPIEVTYTNLQSLISSSGLTPGATYKITGFNKNTPGGNLPYVLYDDGTDSGITIYMKSLTTTLMENNGYGEFYNPKYTGQAEYENTDGTGLYQIWDGDNPDEIDIPAYAIGDVVFWGGYAWENVTGNVGTAVNITELSADWVKLEYSSVTYYNKVIDEISVDWSIGMVVGRRNAANNISVSWTSEYYYWDGYYNGNTNPVALIPWGLYGDVLNNNTYGMAKLSVTDTYAELINFKGIQLVSNIFGSGGVLNGNYFGKNSQLFENSFTIYSYFQNNILKDVNLNYNIVEKGNVTNNVCTNSSGLNNNNINNSIINANTLNNSSINGNMLYLNSTIGNNSLTGSTILQNQINGGQIIYNTLVSSVIELNEINHPNPIAVKYGITYNNLSNNSYIQYNTLSTSHIDNNILNNTIVGQNVLDKISGIMNGNLTNCSITYNVCNASVFELTASGALSNKTLQFNYVRNAYIMDDLSGANIIYNAATKDIFSKDISGTIVLTYINASNALQVVSVTT